MTRDEVASTVKALALGALGAGAAYLLSFPAPFLTGPALVVLVASLLGQKLTVPHLVRDACFVVIGLTLGTGVSPEVLDSALNWPLSLTGLTLGLVTIILAGRLLLTRIWHHDDKTATLASMPGHLNYVIGISTGSGSDVAAVSIIQSIRVVLLMLVVPFAVVLIGYQGGPAASPRAVMAGGVLVITLAGAAILGAGLSRTKLPAAFLLGGMLMSTTTHLAGWFEGAVPAWLAGPSLVVMGTFIGTRFSGVSLVDLRRVTLAGLAVALVAFAIAGLAALTVSIILDLPVAVVLVAFSPGGLEAMAAMAVALDADPAFVAAHHVFRLFLLTFLAPFSLSLNGRKQRLRLRREQARKDAGGQPRDS